MQEIRLRFPASTAPIQRVALTDGDANSIGVEVSFEPFLTDDDLQTWGRRLHDAIFSATENRDALARLLAAPEPRELTIATSEPALLRLPWELSDRCRKDELS